MGDQVTVVGIGGTVRPASGSELAMRVALAAAEAEGARTVSFGGDFLSQLPIYNPGRDRQTAAEAELVEAVRDANGLVIASPGYHGGVSGMIKNALDLLEDLRNEPHPYLEGKAVGCIVTASGAQASGSTLVSLRSVVHALRGWPTPLGATLNGTSPMFDRDGVCTDPKAVDQLRLIGRQVVGFSVARRQLHDGAA